MIKNIKRIIIFTLCLMNTSIWISSTNDPKPPLNFTNYQKFNLDNQKFEEEAAQEYVSAYKVSQFMFLQHAAISKSLQKTNKLI